MNPTHFWEPRAATMKPHLFDATIADVSKMSPPPLFLFFNFHTYHLLSRLDVSGRTNVHMILDWVVLGFWPVVT